MIVRMRPFILPSVALAVLFAGTSRAAEPKPVPRVQALPLPNHEISFQRDGVELARHHATPGDARPFVYPIIGPAGRPLTRMGHPHDPESHSHHNSVWLSHQNVDGANFWEDGRGPKIEQVRVCRFKDGDGEAFLETENVWRDQDGKTALRELRRTRVQILPDDEWILVFEIQLEAPDEPVALGETAFGFIGVRMAKTIGVHDGGGTIRNSEGGVDEVGCFRKPARWVDYSGPITREAIEGITLMDHPMNLNHPVPFHVRDDGWMGAALTFPGAHKIEPGIPMRLRYGLYIHRGQPEPAAIDRQWSSFAKAAFEEFKSGK
jgi:hypothetical protein